MSRGRDLSVTATNKMEVELTRGEVFEETDGEKKQLVYNGVELMPQCLTEIRIGEQVRYERTDPALVYQFIDVQLGILVLRYSLEGLERKAQNYPFVIVAYEQQQQRHRELLNGALMIE